jgi:hypothetical protein
MAKSSAPKHLAARICAVLHESWRCVQALQEPHTPAMDAALEYASDARASVG